MSKPDGKLAWIAKNDSKQYEWAMRYLQKKGIDVSEIQSCAHLVSWSSNWSDSSENRELVSMMRLAWRQKKLRDCRNGKRAYNFVLAASEKKQLDELAKGQGSSITDALVKLISGKFDLQRMAEKQLRGTKRFETSKEYSNFYHSAAITLGGLLGTTLAELSKCTLQLNEMKKTCAQIMEPQQREVEELFKKKKAELFTRLPFVEHWDIMEFKRLIKPPKNTLV